LPIMSAMAPKPCDPCAGPAPPSACKKSANSAVKIGIHLISTVSDAMACSKLSSSMPAGFWRRAAMRRNAVIHAMLRSDSCLFRSLFYAH
jgi:hypothetical protein